MNSHFIKECQNGDSTKLDYTPRSLPNAGGSQTNHHNITLLRVAFGNKSYIPISWKVVLWMPKKLGIVSITPSVGYLNKYPGKVFGSSFLHHDERMASNQHIEPNWHSIT